MTRRVEPVEAGEDDGTTSSAEDRGARKRETAEEKAARIEKEREELLSEVASGLINTVTKRVAWLLNHHDEARASDITLQLLYWGYFDPDKYTGGAINPRDLYGLTRLTTLARSRAKIQNEYKLFLAPEAVQRRRGKLQEEERDRAVEDRPGTPAYTVYADESGKTQQHVLVGSLWFLDGKSMLDLVARLVAWRREKFEGRELHFSQMSRQDLPLYREVVALVRAEAATVGFKVISVPRVGTGNIQETVNKLYYHLLVRGVEHENQTRRAPLPRMLQLYKDEEEAGADALMLAELEDKLAQDAATRYGGQLALRPFRAAQSKGNPLLQIADLLTGAIGRVLNRGGGAQNHKDEFADYVLREFKMEGILDPMQSEGDFAFHIALSPPGAS